MGDRYLKVPRRLGQPLVEDHKACVDAGMDDYLAKPARLRDYETALGKARARVAL